MAGQSQALLVALYVCAALRQKGSREQAVNRNQAELTVCWLVTSDNSFIELSSGLSNSGECNFCSVRTLSEIKFICLIKLVIMT